MRRSKRLAVALDRCHVVVVLASMAAVLAAVPSAGAATTVVHPTGAFPADVDNVQAALDQGATVLLKATDPAGTPTAFDFGHPVTGGGVEFSEDAALVGERVGRHQTTIRGGRTPVAATGPPVEARIEGVRFEEPGRQAVLLASATKAEIIGNHIIDVVGIPFSGATHANGIVAEATENLLIANNVIDGVGGTRSIGVLQCCATGTAEIRHNRITRVHHIGIESAVNRGAVDVHHNLVIPDPEDDSPQWDAGNGISVLGDGAYRISYNRVITGQPHARGIQGADFTEPTMVNQTLVAPVISKNHVTTDNGGAAILLAGEVSDAQVVGNHLAGNGTVALAALDRAFRRGVPLKATTFDANHIAHFQSQEADVFLDTTTQDTVLVGRGGTVIDLGTDNTRSGFTAVPDNDVGAKLTRVTPSP